MTGFWNGYFAARAAPLGRVGAGVVNAAFFNFEPAMVGRAVPGCWDVIEPGAVVELRATGAATALARICSPATVADLIGALPLLRRVAARCDGAGRLMTGANRSLWTSLEARLDQSVRPLAEVWQCCTTLREHRGDGHVAALVTQGLRGLDAHLLFAGTEGVAVETLRDNRGWSEQDWREGVAVLGQRGLLDANGAATELGRRTRDAVEATTDQLAEEPFASLSGEERAGLYRTLRQGGAEVQASGVFPFPNPMGLPPL